MNELTAQQRSLRARLAAHESWKNTADRSKRTLPARRGMDRKFELEVDPHGTLSADERAQRAASARKAYYTRLAYQSAKARRRRGAMQRRGSTHP